MAKDSWRCLCAWEGRNVTLEGIQMAAFAYAETHTQSITCKACKARLTTPVPRTITVHAECLHVPWEPPRWRIHHLGRGLTLIVVDAV